MFIAMVHVSIWLLAWYLLLATGAPDSNGFPSMHAIITTQCGRYFTWQSLGFFYSWRKVGQPGNLTRVLCCTDVTVAAEGDVAQIVPSWIAPDFTNHPTLDDQYLAYNKPEAVIDWTQRANPTEDYVLVIDADMIMNRIFNPVQLGVEPGWAVAAYFDYMQGVDNELAERHIPEIPRRNDTRAGRRGRRADMCGGWTFMTRQDITRVGPYWLKYTEDVRFDEEAYHLTGDVYATKPKMRPWIAEMYGYAYGCAKAGVWHKAHKTGMMYPTYYITEAPYVFHYGLWFEMSNKWSWDKHNYFNFNPLQCPPWDFQPGVPSPGGLFPHPPEPIELKSEGEQLYSDINAVYTINTLNEAFCEQHYLRCPPSEELDRECEKVHRISLQVYDFQSRMEAEGYGNCRDTDPACAIRKSRNECEDNMEYIGTYCRLSCGLCHTEDWIPRKKFIAPWQHKFMKQQDTPQERPDKRGDALGRKGLGGATADVEDNQQQQQAADAVTKEQAQEQQADVQEQPEEVHEEVQGAATLEEEEHPAEQQQEEQQGEHQEEQGTELDSQQEANGDEGQQLVKETGQQQQREVVGEGTGAEGEELIEAYGVEQDSDSRDGVGDEEQLRVQDKQAGAKADKRMGAVQGKGAGGTAGAEEGGRGDGLQQEVREREQPALQIHEEELPKDTEHTRQLVDLADEAAQGNKGSTQQGVAQGEGQQGLSTQEAISEGADRETGLDNGNSSGREMAVLQGHGVQGGGLLATEAQTAEKGQQGEEVLGQDPPGGVYHAAEHVQQQPLPRLAVGTPDHDVSKEHFHGVLAWVAMVSLFLAITRPYLCHPSRLLWKPLEQVSRNVPAGLRSPFRKGNGVAHAHVV